MSTKTLKIVAVIAWIGATFAWGFLGGFNNNILNIIVYAALVIIGSTILNWVFGHGFTKNKDKE